MKSITYAYYSSPNAEKYNKGEGCWMVTLGTSEPIICEDTFRGATKALEVFLDSELPTSPDSFAPSDVSRIFDRRGY